jgi:hypothetical protein
VDRATGGPQGWPGWAGRGIGPELGPAAPGYGGGELCAGGDWGAAVFAAGTGDGAGAISVLDKVEAGVSVEPAGKVASWLRYA